MVGILTNADLLQAMVNEPDMLAVLAPGYDHVDMTPFWRNPRNVMLGDENGAAIFAERPGEPGAFEGHYLLRSGRAGNLELARSFLAAMFTEHAAQAIWGNVHTENRAARAFSRALGFAPRGHSLLPSGRPCVIYVLERATWAKLSGESLVGSAASVER